MNFFQALWNNFTVFTSETIQLSVLMSLSLIINFMLWLWRQQDRKHVIAILIIQAISLSFIILSKNLLALELKALSQGLQQFSSVIIGITFVRLFGLFLFRLVLPLCRINLLRIIEDIVEIIGYGAWLFICLHEVGVNLSSIVTTSAVITGVLALAMQDTLSNILSGLALQLDNSIKVGDWIGVDEAIGCVSEVSWRNTAIETRDWETIIIPNNVLMKAKVTVLGRRKNESLQLRRHIHFKTSYKHFPGDVIGIVQDAIQNGNITNVANYPLASCMLIDLMPGSAHYELRYWLTNIEKDTTSTDSNVRIRINSALQRAGIDFYEPRDIYLTHKDDAYEMRERELYFENRLKNLHQFEIFSILNDSELSVIAENLIYMPFAKGDFIIRQGEIANWLLIVENGSTDVFLKSSSGELQLINTTEGPCLLGEMGLMIGSPRSATVVAKSDVSAYRLDKKSFHALLIKRPELADEITKLLVARQYGIDNAQKSMDDDEAMALLLKQQQNAFLIQLNKFFGLG
ncbi:MAG: mechanosensitive ion channel family protein [Methylococcales bacterium]